MTLDELIKTKQKRLETIPAALQTAIDKKQIELYKALSKELSSLEIKDGKYVASKENLAKINPILERLKQVLFNKEYLDAVKTFASEIEVQARYTNKIAGLLGDFTDDDLFKSVVKKAQQNALLLLDEKAMAAEVFQPLSDILTNAVVSGISYTDAVETLRTFMQGNEEKQGTLSRYAAVYVRDSFAVSDRQYSQLVTKNMGFEFYEYSGGEVAGTRYFCCKREGGIFHKKEIESWGADESLWDKPANASGSCAEHKGGGRNPNTNAQTIFSYLGGYNCNHTLIPKPTKYVPQKDIERARALGYYTG